MIYIIIGSTFLFSYNTWNDWSTFTWNELSSFTWKEILTDGETSDIYPLANNLTILDIVNDQSTCDLEVFDTDNTANFRKGQPIVIYNDDYIIMFSGFLDSVVKTHVGSGSLVAMKYSLACVDNHYVVNKRNVIRAFVDEYIHVAVQWILDNILTVEGIKIGLITATTKTITKSYNYINTKDVLDELSEYAGYTWFISCEKLLYFIPATTYITPFNIILNENGNCNYIMNGTFSVDDSNSEYRNVQYGIGSTNKSVLQTRTFKGDGEIQTWTLPLPLAEQPTIKVNGVIKDVGIGAVNTGYDFYWNEGEPTISQDTSGTKLLSTDILTVEFIGFYPIVVKSSNFTEISDKAILEGTSGIVEDISSETSYKTKDDALDRCNILIETYGINSKTIKYSTIIEGIEAGQLQNIYSELYLLDHDCLITQVEKAEIDYEIEYHITAIAGPISDYWVKKMLATSNAKYKALQDSVDLSSVLLILLSFDKDWVAVDDPNIFIDLYPSNSLLPGSNNFPCFDTNEKCSYIEFNISGGYRLYMTDQVITATQIITTFIVPSQDCNSSFTQIKLFGGNLATETINSGILLSTHNMNYTKNNLESFQIVITYNKW